MSKNISKQQLDSSYKSIMSDIREDMNPIVRMLSVLIHAPVLNQLLNALENSILRPRPLLYASIICLIGVLTLSYNAYVVGYSLSGLELPVLALFGWTIGWIAEIPAIYRKHN